MLATTVNEAASSLTPSGMRALRFFGTFTTSACGPLDTTRSPTANASAPLPTSVTMPTLQ